MFGKIFSLIRRANNSVDRFIIYPYLILGVFGILAVWTASAGFSSQPITFAAKQGFFFILGFVLVLLISRLPLGLLRNPGVMSITMWSLAVVLAVTRFVMPVSANTGAHGWINFPGGFQFQPAELAKALLILFFAFDLSRYAQKNGVMNFGYFSQYFDLKKALPAFLPAMLSLLFIVIMPDIGNFGIIMLILMAVFFSSGFSSRLIAFLSVFAVASYFAITIFILPHINGSGYSIARFMAFVSPWKYAQTSGAQLINSYYAIAHGGITGVGIGNSVEKLGYLPEQNTDFILAIIAEEMGPIVIILLLASIGVLIWRIFTFGIRVNNQYYRLVAYGVAMLFFAQVFVNAGGVSGIIPITGVVFPFISYGGSSFLIFSSLIGVVLSIQRAASIKKRRDSTL